MFKHIEISSIFLCYIINFYTDFVALCWAGSGQPIPPRKTAQCQTPLVPLYGVCPDSPTKIRSNLSIKISRESTPKERILSILVLRTFRIKVVS